MAYKRRAPDSYGREEFACHPTRCPFFILTGKEVKKMCCGTAKSPCIEVELHPGVAENCCGTAQSPCIEVELHPDVKENSSDSDNPSEDG